MNKRFPIGTKVKLDLEGSCAFNLNNLEYFERNFKGVDPHETFTVVGWHLQASDCIYLNCNQWEAIAYQRFKRADQLPEDLFEI